VLQTKWISQLKLRLPKKLVYALESEAKRGVESKLGMTLTRLTKLLGRTNVVTDTQQATWASHSLIYFHCLLRPLTARGL
jgi:hypothetical protein